MGYRFDTQTWPVVCFEFFGRLSADELTQYFADSDALMRRGQTYAAVLDASDMLVPEVEIVRKQANWLRDNGATLARYNRGIAMVIRSSVIRGLVRAVIHFQEIPVPYEWFSNRDEAMSWAAERATSG